MSEDKKLFETEDIKSIWKATKKRPRSCDTTRSEQKCEQCKQYEIQIEELKHRIECLEKKGKESRGGKKEKILSLPILDLSEERISRLVNEFYTEDMFFSGQKGMAQFVFSFVARDSQNRLAYRITNRDKNVFEFRTLENEIQKDTGCKILFNRVYRIILKKARIFYKEMISEIQIEEDDNEQSDNEMDDETEEIIANAIIESEEKKESVDKKEHLNEEKKEFGEEKEKKGFITEEKEKNKEGFMTEKKEGMFLKKLVDIFLEIKKSCEKNNKKIFVNELLLLIESD